MMDIVDTTVCANCYREYAEHNYVANSIHVYMCPVEQQITHYGKYMGCAPRDFYPDAEMCTLQELADFKTAKKMKTHDAEYLRLLSGVGVTVSQIQTQFEPIEERDTRNE